MTFAILIRYGCATHCFSLKRRHKMLTDSEVVDDSIETIFSRLNFNFRCRNSQCGVADTDLHRIKSFKNIRQRRKIYGLVISFSGTIKYKSATFNKNWFSSKVMPVLISHRGQGWQRKKYKVLDIANANIHNSCKLRLGSLNLILKNNKKIYCNIFHCPHMPWETSSIVSANVSSWYCHRL